MIRSLWISKTGLDAQQTQLDVISNNLANVATNGFKRSRAVFEDLLYQTVRQPGAPTSQQTNAPAGLQIGTGVRPVAASRVFTQGNLQQTGNSLDIAINGRFGDGGFFNGGVTLGRTRFNSCWQNALPQVDQTGVANNLPRTEEYCNVASPLWSASGSQIKAQVEETTSDYDREKLQERLAKLAGGVAVIRVGGATEVEVKEKKDRVDDALNATRAAAEEGIVPGGGTALLRARGAVAKLSSDNTDVQAGIKIVLKALEAPIRQIVENAGIEGSIVINKIGESKSQTFGFNAQTEQYVDMIESGIVDPAKVVRTALQDAASVASLLITTEAMIADAPKDKGAAMPPMPGGGGMGGMDF